MIGWVDGEHVTRQGRSGETLGDHIAIGRERGLHVLRQPWVAERGTRFGIARDEPGIVPVGERDRVNCAELPHLLEEREWPVAVVVTPRGECPRHSFEVVVVDTRMRDLLQGFLLWDAFPAAHATGSPSARPGMSASAASRVG